LKINKRLLIIAIFSLVIASFIVAYLYVTIKKSVQPEPETRIVYFKENVEKGTLIKNEDVDTYFKLKNTPVSLVPKNAIKNLNALKEKTLLIDGSTDDFILESDIIERGETKVDIDNMYQIGIPVDNIANFLGTQIKLGKYYGLIALSEEGYRNGIYKAKVVSIVDSTGKIVVENGESTVAEINIAVDSIDDMYEIAEKKKQGSFDLVSFSEDRWKEINGENKENNEIN
jgi:hypothetical protein